MHRTLSDAPDARWGLFAYAYAATLGCVTAYFLFGLPIQLTDSFANLLGIQRGSLWDVFTGQLGGTGYFRPLLQTQLKVVYQLSGGRYFSWFRSLQAIQVLAVLVLSVRLLRPRRLSEFAVVPCALAIVLGLHTFAGTIREAFPINTFLTLVVCCLAAANLARTRGGWFVDVLAALLLAFSLLTLETGILVWVILAAAYALGDRGVSLRGLVVITLIFGGYFALRTMYFHVGAPGFDERPTGFGFRVLEPSEVVARFASNPAPLLAYNFIAAISTVLFAEPRGGVWRFVDGLVRRDLPAWELINVITSTLTTVLLIWYVATRARNWTHWRVTDGDRLVLLFLVVLPVNALLCLVYVKDVVMSPSGVFYALAASVAIRELIARGHGSIRVRPLSIAAVAMVMLVSAGWGWKLLGIHYSLRTAATTVRSEWAYEDEWEAKNHIDISGGEALALRRTLLDDAIWRRPAPPRLDVAWAADAFDKTQ